MRCCEASFTTCRARGSLQHMAPLPNIRHERFAVAVIKTGVAAKAYLEAGFKPTTRNALDVSACQLLRKPKVKARIWELQTQIARRSAVTLDTLLDDLEAARERAHELGQPSAAIAATMGKARLLGLLVDRKEHSAPGEFAPTLTRCGGPGASAGRTGRRCRRCPGCCTRVVTAFADTTRTPQASFCKILISMSYKTRPRD